MWFAGDHELSGYAFRLRLDPLTLGHLFLLHEIDSPLLDERATRIRIDDVLTSALLCALTADNSRRLLSSRFVRWIVRAWVWRNRKANLQDEARAFMEWFETNLSAPRARSPQGSKRASAPHAYRLLTCALQLGYTEQQAMDLPVYRVTRLWITMMEMEDRVNLMTRSENELFDFVKAEKAERAEKARMN